MVSRRAGAATSALALLALATALLAAAPPATASATAVGATTTRSGSPSVPAKPVLGANQVGTAADVPWHRIGPGWYLTLVNKGTRDVSTLRVDHQILELVDPLGGRYVVLRRPVGGPTGASYLRLTDWSTDAHIALFVADSGTLDARALEVDLRHETRHVVPLAARVTTAAFGPAEELYATSYDGTRGARVARVDQAGGSVVIARHTSGLTLPRPDGRRIVVAPFARSAHRLEVVSSTGRRVRTLRLPAHCTPNRTWSPTSVLATCTQGGTTRLYRVPVGGGTPTAISGRHGAGSVDLGDIDARRLGRTTFLEASSSGSRVILVRQRAGGHVVRVDVPVSSGDVFLLGTRHDHLVLRTGAPLAGAADTISLFDPVAHQNRSIATLPIDQEFATLLTFGERRAMIG